MFSYLFGGRNNSHIENNKQTSNSNKSLNDSVFTPIKNNELDIEIESFEIIPPAQSDEIILSASTWNPDVIKRSPVKTRYVFSLISTEKEYKDKLDNAARKSAHPVFMFKRNGLSYFFKQVDNNYMAYLEAYANYRYRRMLPGKVAPNRTCLDEFDQPVGVCSKGIPDFETFKDKLKSKGKKEFINWFNSYLQNPDNLSRFIEVLAVAFYRCEDDLHAGNIAINNHDELFLFDTDCSMWPLMAKFKGPRAGVDLPYHRDPATDFILSRLDIKHFPNLQTSQPHYFPGRSPYYIANSLTKPIIKCNTDNLYLDEIIDLVQKLDASSYQHADKKHPNILNICFRVWLNEMLCGAEITAPIATLYIPKEVAHDKKNLIEDIIEFEQKRRDEFWSILPTMEEFYYFLKEDEQNKILYECLLNCLECNEKFKKTALKNPNRAKELEAAICPLEKIIINYNTLVKIVNECNSMSFDLMPSDANKINKVEDKIIGLNEIKEVDVSILKKFETQLKNDLVKRKKKYDDWINNGKQKKNPSIT